MCYQCLSFEDSPPCHLSVTSLQQLMGFVSSNPLVLRDDHESKLPDLVFVSPDLRYFMYNFRCRKDTDDSLPSF